MTRQAIIHTMYQMFDTLELNMNDLGTMWFALLTSHGAMYKESHEIDDILMFDDVEQSFLEMVNSYAVKTEEDFTRYAEQYIEFSKETQYAQVQRIMNSPLKAVR